MAVTLVELPGGKLEINIKHFGGFGMNGKRANLLTAGNTVADLHGQHGFAGVGIGKEDAELALVPKLAEKHF
jgi:hypothetical protein